MAPKKRKGGWPDTGRGRGAPQLPAVRCTEAEANWAYAETARLNLNLTKLVRNRFFRSMPGYKPET